MSSAFLQTYRNHVAERAVVGIPPLPLTALNPDELVCSHAKRTGVARSPLKAGENPQCRVDAQLQNIANDPALEQAFFRHPSVSYITDW